MQGYTSGSGVAAGVGRGLLGAVGLPISGAFDFVSAVSAGIAMSAGVSHYIPRRRAGRVDDVAPGRAARARFARCVHAALDGDGRAGPCASCQPANVVLIYLVADSDGGSERTEVDVEQPALVLSCGNLLVLQEGGVGMATAVSLAGTLPNHDPGLLYHGVCHASWYGVLYWMFCCGCFGLLWTNIS